MESRRGERKPETLLGPELLAPLHQPAKTLFAGEGAAAYFLEHLRESGDQLTLGELPASA